MGIKINYVQVARDADEMINRLDELKRDLDNFRRDVDNYASLMQDQISESAIDVCNEIDITVKEARALIANMSEKLNEGMNLLDNTENEMGGKIRNV